MISSFNNISDGDEVGLRKALTQQPVSVAVRANCDSFHDYGGGVLDDDCGGGEQAIDHAILAVGFDQTGNNSYYIVKNSWGGDWGEKGYVRMKIGDNLDCIACKATYPIASKDTPPKPAPEVQCPTGTFDQKLKTPYTCPKGSSCCCSRHCGLFGLGRCCATDCCLSDAACKPGHGCKKSSE